MAKLPHVKNVRDEKGRVRLYFNTGAKTPRGATIYKRLPDENDPTFGSFYAAYKAARTKRDVGAPEAMTIGRLFALFEKSDKWRGYAPATQAHYRHHIGMVVEWFDPTPAADMCREWIQQFVDELGDRPGTANAIIGSGLALYAWALRRGYAQINPFKNVEVSEMGEHEPWPEHLIEDALADDAVRLPVALLYFTAQRIGDVLRMRWSDIRDGAIHVTQQKTGTRLEIHLHRQLLDILATTPKAGLTILEVPGRTAKAKSDKLRREIQAWAEARGFEVVPHGLRKNAVNALLEAGNSVAETAAITGQSLAMIEHYAKQRNQSKLSKAAVLRWQNKSGTGKTGKIRPKNGGKP